MQFLNFVSVPQITEDQSKDCEFILSEKDLLLVLNSMPNNKSPGNDGLTKAFYEVFWEDDQFCIYNSWNREYLNIEHSKAIIDKTKRIDEEISKHGLKKDLSILWNDALLLIDILIFLEQFNGFAQLTPWCILKDRQLCLRNYVKYWVPIIASAKQIKIQDMTLTRIRLLF